MSNGSSPQSLGDFAALLVREIAQALLLAREHAPYVAVQTVKLRLGKLPEGEPDAEAPAPEGLILSERYPLLDGGWELELELGNQVRARIAGQPVALPAAERTALDLFGPCPTTAIKGVSRRWQERLAALQVNRVAELAQLDDGRLHRLQRQEHSLLPRDFRSKARLLATPVPSFPAGALGRLSLHEVLALTAADLRQTLSGRRVSDSELQRFDALLDALAISVDNALLRKLSLGELLDSGGLPGGG